MNVDTWKLNFSLLRPQDVEFYLVVHPSTKEKFGNNTTVNVLKPFKFIIHGWIENSRRRWYGKITKEFLTKGDFNVIQVDWEIPARMAYISSAMNTKFVGKK